MLLRYFNKTPLNELAGLGSIAETVLRARCDQPDFPLEVLWAVSHSIHQVFNGRLFLAHAFISLRTFYIYLPA